MSLAASNDTDAATREVEPKEGEATREEALPPARDPEAERREHLRWLETWSPSHRGL
ncbi:MAG: hypothetical protein M3O87_01665 [Candidatus Dormibacteraeota bacterium]|nr:hypothetical protein [Candidatus Dormibacteraeota bacterium]